MSTVMTNRQNLKYCETIVFKENQHLIAVKNIFVLIGSTFLRYWGPFWPFWKVTELLLFDKINTITLVALIHISSWKLTLSDNSIAKCCSFVMFARYTWIIYGNSSNLSYCWTSESRFWISFNCFSSERFVLSDSVFNCYALRDNTHGFRVL